MLINILHWAVSRNSKINKNTTIADVMTMIDERQVFMENGQNTNVYHKKIEMAELSHVVINLLAI